MSSRQARVRMQLQLWEESIGRQDFEGAIKSLEVARTLLSRSKDEQLLSHVEKLLEDARWARNRKVKPSISSVRPACAFCRRSRPAVARLVGGPGVFVCNECVAAAARRMGRKIADSPLPRLVECSFCGRRRVSRAIVLASDRAVACRSCMELAAEVLAESEPPVVQHGRATQRRRKARRRRVVR